MAEVELGVLTACVGAGLAALLAYVTNRRLIVGHQVLAFLAMAPIVIPGTVLAVALFIAYTRPPFLLYGTLWILFIAVQWLDVCWSALVLMGVEKVRIIPIR